MKLNKTTIGALAGMAMFGAGMQTANAGTAAVVAAAPTFATEIFGPGSAATQLTVPNVKYTMGIAVTAGKTFQITYTLTNGLFVATPAVPAVTGATVTLRSGGIGTNTVTYDVSVTTGFTTATVLTLTMPKVKGANALATAGAKVLANVSLKDVLGPLDTTGVHSIPVATSANGVTTTFTPGTAQIADVAYGLTKFTGGLAGVTDISLGSEAIVFGAQKINTAAAGITDVNSPSTITLTLNGNFAAAVGTNVDANAATKDGVYIDVNANNAFNAGTDIAATTLTATQATFAGLTVAQVNGKTIRMNVDGVTQISATTPAVSSLQNFTAATLLDETTTGTATKITQNGTSFTFNRITAAGSLRMVNNAATGTGSITITAKNAAGANIPQVTALPAGVAALPAAVAPAQTVTISGATLMNSFPAAAQFSVVVRSSSVASSLANFIPGNGFSVSTFDSGVAVPANGTAPQAGSL